jgi:hypothetical protein
MQRVTVGAHEAEPTREAAMAAFAKSWRREWAGHSLTRRSQRRFGCPDRPHNVGPKHFDEPAGLLKAVQEHDRVVPAAAHRVRQANGTAQALAIA